MSYFAKQKKINIFLRWLLAFLALEALSIVAWYLPIFNIVILILIALISIFLFFKNSIYLLLIPLAEIFWGSLGHSFDYNFFSTRLVIFIPALLVFLVQNTTNIKNIKLFKDRLLFIIFFSLL